MNKKGFVLMETLVVTIFVLFIFGILYNSIVPLLGRYKTLSYYDDLSLTYDLYHIRNFLENDRYYNDLISRNYQKITCNNGTVYNTGLCSELFYHLGLDDDDELIYLNMTYRNELENDSNISDDIKDYLKYIDEAKRVLLIQNDWYTSFLEITTIDKSVNESSSDKINTSISESTCNPAFIDTDGTIYLSGTNDCVNFNYVYYSGHT